MSSNSISPAYIKTGEDRILVLDKLEQTVGREEGADLIIPDKSISRVHAVLRWEGDTWTLEDLESRNKTFINEKAIQPKSPTPLNDGCTVHFGYVKVTFHMGVPAHLQADAGATVAIDINELRRQQESAKAPAAAPAASAQAEPPSVGPGGTIVMKAVKRGENVAHPTDALGYLELASVDKSIRLYIRATIVKIGTDAKECDLLIHEREADKEHAEIRYNRDKKVVLKNLSSTFGTWVDGKRVAKADLSEGTMIKIGDSTFIFHHIKDPIFEDDKNAGMRNAVRFVIVAVLLFLAAGGGYFVYIQSTRKKGPEAITGVRPEVKQELLDLVNTQKYKRCLERIEEISTSSTVDEDTKAMAVSFKADVEILARAQDALAKKSGIPRAYQEVQKVSPGEVATAAQVDIEDIKAKFGRYVTDLSTDFQAAEESGQFDTALTQIIPELLKYDQAGAAKWDIAQRRVTLKQKINNLYGRATAGMKGEFEPFRAEAEDLVKQAEAIAATGGDSATSLQPFVDKAKDIIHDADFMRAYFAFDASSSTDVIRSIYNAISADYDKDGKDGGRRKDLEERLAKLDRAIELHRDFEKTLSEIQGMTAGTEVVDKLDKLVQNRNEAVRIERDGRFAVREAALNHLDQLEGYKKQQVAAIWRRPPPNFDRTTGAGRIDASLETRERANLTLRMFPKEARFDRLDTTIVANWVRDPELLEVFKEASRAYDRSRTEVESELYSAYRATKEEKVLVNTDNILNRLLAASIPEDDETATKVTAFRNRLATEFK